MNKDQLLRLKQLLIEHKASILYALRRYSEGGREDLASRCADDVKEVDGLINELDEKLETK